MIIRSQKVLNPDQVHIWRANLADWIKYLELFSPWLTLDENHRLARYKIAAKQHGFLISRGLLRIVLSAYLGLIPEDIKLAVSPDGKPYLRDSKIKFSLSHTQDQWMMSITAVDDCGVDIEANLPSRNLDRIIKNTFHPAERKYLNELRTGSDHDQEFLSIWTAKEAYLKGLGLGIKEYPVWFSVLPDPNDLERYILNDPRLSKENQNWTIRRLDKFADCQGAVAASKKDFVVRTKDLVPSDLIDKAVSSAYPAAAESMPD